jgi:hypothetical protein
VFVGDASGYLYSVNSSGTAIKSLQVAVSPGIHDGPLVDISEGYLYAFVSEDTSTTTSTNACDGNSLSTPVSCNAVIQLPVGFGTATKFNESVMGIGSTTTLYAGSFDNQYWTSGTGTGNLYTVAGTGVPSPKLSQIPISLNAISAGANCQNGYTAPANSNVFECSDNVLNPITSAAAEGSPLTEIYTGSIDYLFVGVTADGNTTGCTGGTGTGGCVYSWNATTTLGTSSPGNVAATAGSAETGGTSGIIIDNISATSGASQIYFSILGTSGSCTTSGALTDGSCAVQASQTAP